MSERIEADGTMTTGELFEAAASAGASIQPLWSKVLAYANLLVMALLLGVAGIALYDAFVPGRDAAPLAVLAAIVVLAILMLVWLPRVAVRSMYGPVTAGPFASGLRFSAGPDGVALRNGRSDWRTDWRDVTDIRQTRRTLLVVASGVALPVAKRNLDDAGAALERLRDWRAGAA